MKVANITFTKHKMSCNYISFRSYVKIRATWLSAMCLKQNIILLISIIFYIYYLYCWGFICRYYVICDADRQTDRHTSPPNYTEFYLKRTHIAQHNITISVHKRKNNSTTLFKFLYLENKLSLIPKLVLT